MKYFNTIVIMLFTLIVCTCVVNAQEVEQQDMKDKIRQLEIAYLAKQLNLTPEEAQGFWPLYNKYTLEVEQLIAARKGKQLPAENTVKMSDKTLDTKEDELTYEKKMLDIRSRYKQEFLKVLPSGKASSVFKTEREFRGQLLRHLKERRDPGRRAMPGRQRF